MEEVREVTDRELIYAAFELGANFGRTSVVGGVLSMFKINLTPEMVERLSRYRDGITLSGHEPFERITTLRVSDAIIEKLLRPSLRVVIIAQLYELSAEDLRDRFGLTPEEIDEVRKAFEYAQWRLRPSTPTE